MATTVMRILDLEDLGSDCFAGWSPPAPSWIYGGQAVAQSLAAAIKTVTDDRDVNSMHCNFLRAGDPTEPVIYKVQRLRDGRTFSTRYVTAYQSERVIFAMTATFNVASPAPFRHQLTRPDVPPPSGPRSSIDLPDFDRGWPSWLVGRDDIDVRHAEVDGLKRQLGEALIWSRVTADVPDDHRVHACLFAYLSDISLLHSVRHHHEPIPGRRQWRTKTLDHSIWFHRLFRANEWLLTQQFSPIAEHARGLVRGSVFALNGELVGSTAQEGVILTNG